MVPVWVVIVIIATGVTYNLVYGPKQRKKAAERRQLFEERKASSGQERANS